MSVNSINGTTGNSVKPVEIKSELKEKIEEILKEYKTKETNKTDSKEDGIETVSEPDNQELLNEIQKQFKSYTATKKTNTKTVSSEEYYNYARKQVEIDDIIKELRHAEVVRNATILSLTYKPEHKSYEELVKEAEEIYYSRHPEEKDKDTTYEDSVIENMLSEHNKYILEKMAKWDEEHPNPEKPWTEGISVGTYHKKERDAYLAELETEYKANNQDYNNYCAQKELAEQNYKKEKDENKGILGKLLGILGF